MSNVTIEDYRKAEQLLEEYKICSGCGEVFKTKDTSYSIQIQYGNEKYWCNICHPRIKNDW